MFIDFLTENLYNRHGFYKRIFAWEFWILRVRIHRIFRVKGYVKRAEETEALFCVAFFIMERFHVEDGIGRLLCGEEQ